MANYCEQIVVFKRKGGRPLWDEMYEEDEEYGVEFKIVDYEDSEDVRDFLKKNELNLYIIQTKSNELRLQCNESPIEDHCLLSTAGPGINDFFFLAVAIEKGPNRRFKEHMLKHTDHSKCAIE
ncbi:hypothetical protein Cantr_07067 [Candida viswanathii]|uniref:Uncharacterized protein n=1 Tax=Candida viswanathii TaxID=5486 RepID=A0A367Y203_9ASCO|nr:hypothetical protein Cantr_07067 [Candida viswanathii]